MGALCSKRSLVDKSPSESPVDANGLKTLNQLGALGNHGSGEVKDKWMLQPPLSFSDRMMATYGKSYADKESQQLLRSLLAKSRSTKSKSPASSKTGTTKVSQSSSVPPNTRDSLYHGLPPPIKSALRSKLQSFEVKEELTAPQIKAEMGKTLRWLVLIATNTAKAHHGFGWVGEWANTGAELSQKLPGQADLI